MLDALKAPEQTPPEERVSRIQGLILATLTPVTPLPPDRKLVWNLVVLFAAFSLIAAIPVGYNGFHVLSPFQRFAYYMPLFLCATWLSLVAVQEMIPGSRRKTSPAWTVVATTVSLVLLVSALFHQFALDQFVRQGVPCLRLGCICAVLCGAVTWFTVRRGFFVSPVTAGLAVGSFAGLAGVAVLALHCPIENSAHIIVWHLGAMIFGAIAGILVGILRR